jgi:hypothetical protein
MGREGTGGNFKDSPKVLALLFLYDTKLSDNEPHPPRHQATDESNVAGEAIKLRHDDRTEQVQLLHDHKRRCVGAFDGIYNG